MGPVAKVVWTSENLSKGAREATSTELYPGQVEPLFSKGYIEFSSFLATLAF